MPSRNLEIRSGRELRDLVKTLREHSDGKRLVKELRSELRKAAKPLVPAVRSSINRIPSKGQTARLGRKSLRKRMASATRLDVQTGGREAGVSVRVERTRMPAGEGNLPAYMEGEPRFTRWRSPNWGRDQWKTQPSHPFFYRAVRPGETRAVDAVNQVIDRIARELEK